MNARERAILKREGAAGAERLLREEQEARKRRLVKTLATRKAKAEAEGVVLFLHQELVARVRVRDRNRCQLCDEGGPRPSDPIDPHHLELGAAKAKHERISNMLCAHRTCHDAYHSNPRAFVERVKAWCRAHYYPIPNRKEFR